MRIEMTVCDKCARIIPDGEAATLLRPGGLEHAHLCRKCVDEFLLPKEKIIQMAKEDKNG